MKKLVTIVAMITVMAVTALAQTVGYVNTETILSKIPEYNQAQQQLERLKSQYDTQFQSELKVIENLFAKYQQEKAQLNDMQRQMRENDIISRERTLKERQMEVFGNEGVMAARSKELLEPIKDLVLKAVESVAKESGVGMIFDISATQGVIYNDPKADLTNRVLDKMGLNR